MKSSRDASAPLKAAPQRRRLKRGLQAALGVLAVYYLVAYLILPWVWEAHERNAHPALESAPHLTVNAQGIPGDPLNVGLIGSRAQLVSAMLTVGWKPADPVTLETSLKIAESVLFDRPDPAAPVSNLFVFGRRQDLAFEQEVGPSASHRHHVRWWQSAIPDNKGRALWLGSVTYDSGSGVSHLTGEITHHIGPDVDAERDHLMALLMAHGQIPEPSAKPGRGATNQGRNAGGDSYSTDGLMMVAMLKSASASEDAAAPGHGK